MKIKKLIYTCLSVAMMMVVKTPVTYIGQELLAVMVLIIILLRQYIMTATILH